MTLIRDAEAHDLASITAIYNDAVLNSTAIWNDQTVDVANRLTWWRQHLDQSYPVIVAVDEDGRVIGYATFGDWRNFDGYRYTVEHSLYVDSESRGEGVGEQLLRVLIERAGELGKHAMVAGIDAKNQASIRLHQKLGFQVVGTMPEVGTKFGRWLDLTYMQLIL